MHSPHCAARWRQQDQRGLDGLLGNVKSTSDLNTAFSELGMDSGMVGQFAPVILQYLGSQGASTSVLGKLAPGLGYRRLRTFRAQLFDARVFLLPELVHPALDSLAKCRIVLVIPLP